MWEFFLGQFVFSPKMTIFQMDYLPTSSGSGSFANRLLGPESHINHTSLDIWGDRQISQIHILEKRKFKKRKNDHISIQWNTGKWKDGLLRKFGLAWDGVKIDMALSVPLGSCRLRRPVAHLESLRPCAPRRKGSGGFVHLSPPPTLLSHPEKTIKQWCSSVSSENTMEQVGLGHFD